MDQLSTVELLKVLGTVEKLGDEIVSDRHSIVEMDRIRNKNREALGALRRPNSLTVNEEYVWMNVGDIFIRTTKDGLKNILEEDQKYLDVQIDTTRNNLKPKVAELNKAMGKPELVGFNLQPLSKDEINAIHQAISPHMG